LLVIKFQQFFDYDNDNDYDNEESSYTSQWGIMYRKHFGLTARPFGLTPDADFLFSHAGYQEALNVLLVALQCEEGFIKITGEVGTGKTLLCRRLLDGLGEKWGTAYVPNPLLEPLELYGAVAEELGARWSGACDSHHVLKIIARRLIELAGSGRRVVLCIDEAQVMPDRTLEALRLLSNLETKKRKLLHIVLFGQPELDDRLAGYALRQLRQRIVFSYRLPALRRQEVAGYVVHRLRVAGYQGKGLFAPGALNKLWFASRGIPRLVNILAHKAMLAAYGQGNDKIRVRHVRRAVADTVDARRGWFCLPCWGGSP
jgi:MSHA biogenesis protein MshM